MIKNITEFGGVADGITDNYAAFQAAAAYASTHKNTTINFSEGTFYIDKYRTIKNDPITDIFWNNCIGLKILGTKGTIISLNGNFFRPLDRTIEDGSKKSYTSGLCPFYLMNCSNVQIKNLEITGNVQDTTRAAGIDISNPSVSESENIMVRFTKCDKVTLSNLYLHHAECDGLKIGGDRVNGVWTNSANFTVTNVNCYNNGRLGMSIGGLDNGLFKNCKFNNSGFTEGDYGHNDPAGGVDIEPGEFHHNNNIKFEGCAFEGSYGSQFICSAPDKTIGITLLGCVLSSNVPSTKTQGITILAKNVLIDGCTIKLYDRIMKFTNPKVPGTTIKIANSTIEANGCCLNTTIDDLQAELVLQNNKFNYTGVGKMTKNFISLATKNLQFINNNVFISSAALKTRPKGTHVLIQNAKISSGNTFLFGTKVNYAGTLIVNDIITQA